MKKKIGVTCPHCSESFDVEVNPAALLASGTTDAKNRALQKNARKPRPKARALTPDQVEEIRRRIEAGEKRGDLAQEYGVSTQTIRNYLS